MTPAGIDLERELADAFAEQRAPAFARASTEAWVMAIDAELNRGRHELAQYAVRRLREVEPDLEWARSVQALLDGAPPKTSDAFVDDPTKDVQIIQSNSDAVIFAFCGLVHNMAFELGLFHRRFGQLPASIVYLRDFHKLLYLQGVRSLGPTMAATIEAMRGIAKDLGASRILCFGNSGGAYGALRYGILLGARAVFCSGCPVNMTTKFSKHLGRTQLPRRLEAAFPGAQLDLRELYLEAGTRPQVTLAYGEQSWNDRVQAETMKGIEGVRLIPVPGVTAHGVISPLIRQKKFRTLMQDFVATR